MVSFVDKVRDAEGRLLWLDYVDYAGRLLAAGTIPWMDTTACSAWLRKAQGLLRSDAIGLPVGRIVAAWLATHPGLREAMGAKLRAVYPIKTLLGDEELRAHVVALFTSLRGSVPGPFFALELPSPRAWVVDSYEQAHGTAIDAGEDEADSASLYIADFLRAFGECGVDALVLVESPATEPATAAEIACYQSVLNVAGHYRWAAGLQVPGSRFDGTSTGLDFVISPAAVSGALHGRVVPVSYWADGVLPAADAPGFLYATVPADSAPEQVLERLASLR